MGDVMNHAPRIGLALGSGGSRGLAHVGVLKVLADAGIPVHAVAGSSAGALVGALYALTGDIEYVEDRVTRPGIVDVVKSILDLSLKGGVVKGRRLAEFIKQEFGNKEFFDLRLPFQAVATNLKTGQATRLSSGKLRSALLASTAVPFIFPPVRLGSKVLVDGGLSEPVPVSTVKAMHVDIVIAVNLDGASTVQFGGRHSKALDVVGQSLPIYRYNLAALNAQNADLAVEPHTGIQGIVGWKGFLQSEKIVKTGEQAMRKLLPALKEKISSFQV